MDQAACNNDFLFGPFRLKPAQRALLSGDALVDLTPRAYDILEFLIRNRDRVISRDEVIAQVWRGVVVGDNNLSVQISMLRRTLQAHGANFPLIVSVPGRGYRFVTPTDLAPAADRPGQETGPSAEAVALPASTGSARRRLPLALGILLIAGILVLVLAIREFHAAMTGPTESPPPDARLSLLVDSPDLGREEPAVVALSRTYMMALLAHLQLFEDLTLFTPATGAAPPYTPHFTLRLTVTQQGGEAIVALGLSANGDGSQIRTYSEQTSLTATSSERSALVMRLIRKVRPSIFEREQAYRKDKARDEIDTFIDAKVASAVIEGPDQLEPVLALAERAVSTPIRSGPATALLSYLLSQKMLWSSQANGNELGERALSLIEPVFRAHPDNPLYIMDRVYALLALGRLDEAEYTARRGLVIEPGYYKLIQALGEIFLQRDELVLARQLIAPTGTGTTDDRLASLAFAENNAEEAVEIARQVIGAAAPSYETHFTRLMEISALVAAGRVGEAKGSLSIYRRLAPEALQHISFLRQNFYALPDRAWVRFKKGLAEAGLDP